MKVWLASTIVGVCLITEGFFSGSEIAVVSANRLNLQTRADKGSAGAKLALNLLEKPETLLGTCLIGTNLSTVTASTAAAAALVGVWPDFGEAAAVALLFPCILLFGELIPKSVYQHYADRMAPIIAWPLRVFSLVFSPALFLLRGATNALLKLTGGAGDAKRTVTREDIVLLLEASDEVHIDDEDRELIQRVFEFSEARVSEVMKPLIEVLALPQDAPARRAVQLMVEHGHSRLPVYDGRVDRVTGVVSHADLLFASDLDRPCSELATEPFFIPETKRIEEVFLEFNARKQRIAIPVDEYGGAVGLITMEDILEEIVGDIADETDARTRSIRQVGARDWTAAGRVELDALEAEVGLELPEGDYETLAGFLLHELGHVPKVGERVLQGGYLLEVSRASDRAILEVRLRRM
jgi:CBS domain containing-hemolysin-like protein